MKKILTLLSVCMAGYSFSQSTATLLCDFDGVKQVSFMDYDGMLDSAYANPSTTGLNTSSLCGRYIRKETAQYDNLKLYAHTKFVDISPFAQAVTANKITMKVMSKMPVGTIIDIQLGTRVDQTYPGGIHSIYTATTTLQNQWEQLAFTLSNNLSANNGFQLPGSIDKMVILFRPNSMTADTVYFDDVMGPAVEAPVGLRENKTSNGFSVFQNKPNPAHGQTSILLDLNTSGNVNITLYDMLGKNVATLLDEQMQPGTHTVDFNTSGLNEGVYFYTVRKGNSVQTLKMIVAE